MPRISASTSSPQLSLVAVPSLNTFFQAGRGTLHQKDSCLCRGPRSVLSHFIVLEGQYHYCILHAPLKPIVTWRNSETNTESKEQRWDLNRKLSSMGVTSHRDMSVKHLARGKYPIDRILRPTKIRSREKIGSGF